VAEAIVYIAVEPLARDKAGIAHAKVGMPPWVVPVDT